MLTTDTAPIYRDLSLALVRESSWNPRKHFDAGKLQELATSIREKGVIEPIVVRPLATSGTFEIVAGARRFRASMLAEKVSIPALVRALDDVAALELAVIENQQRENVHPLEEAEGYAALAEADKKFTPAVIAAKVGKSESYIYRRLKLLALEPDLRQALAEDRLTVAHAEKLLRLTPALRKEAADPEDGVVWSMSPLLDYDDDGKWVPGADDLRPLSDLEEFIRVRSAFNPAAEDTKHFQPDLAVQLEAVVDEEFTDTTDSIAAVAEFQASIVSLSEDKLARSSMRLAKGEASPLTPSRWHEIKGLKDRCDHVVKGCITHGGPARLLDVCVKRSCKKHFPPAEKPVAQSSTDRASRPAAREEEDYQARWKREAAERELAQKVWAAVQPQAMALVKAHLAKVKFGPAMLRIVLVDTYRELASVQAVQEDFKVKLTPKTCALVLALSTLDWNSADALRDSVVRAWRFDWKPVAKLIAAETVKASKPAAAAPPVAVAKPAKKKLAAKVAKGKSVKAKKGRAA